VTEAQVLTQLANRKGAVKRSAIPSDILQALNHGHIATVNLVEGLAIDFNVLLAAVTQPLGLPPVTIDPNTGITQRMQQAAQALYAHGGPMVLDWCMAHPSDTVQGWACYMVGQCQPTLTLPQQLEQLQPPANSNHFAVREWAWLACRPAIVANPLQAVTALMPWAEHAEPNLRRFASESTRPRGVWCAHINMFKQQPQLALPLLNPLFADTSRYVQLSVGNWLNDAGKTQPQWVTALCQQWLASVPKSSQHPTQAIVQRALRNIK
jgi:3-methyladenine DNA glycosylase AlkC